ncbi:hypothetical protein Tco_0486983 [Tanacetum coccineum]
MALLAQSFRATLPQTNNQLRTSSNTRNQATIQDGRVVVQNVQGRQNQNQRYFARGNGTAGNGVPQYRLGMPMQPMQVHRYSDYFKDKMLLMQAQENGAVLDEEELLFWLITSFQADECDAFDSDVDDEPMSVYIHGQFVLSRVSKIHKWSSNCINLSEVNDISVVPSYASFALSSVCVSPVNDAIVPHDPIAIERKIYKEQVAIYEQRAIMAKWLKTALYDGDELLKPHHVPVMVPSSEEELELAEATRNKLHVEMNDSACVEKRVNITPPNYSK